MEDNYVERQSRRISRANLQRYEDGSVTESYLEEKFHRRRLGLALGLLNAKIDKSRGLPIVLDVGGVSTTAKALISMGFIAITGGYGLRGKWPDGACRIEMDVSEGLPFRNDVFDGILAGEIIEHLFDSAAFVKEAHRVLRVSGVLVLTTPNLAALQDRILFLFGRSPTQVDPLHPFRWLHIRPYTSNKLREVLSGCGFSLMTLTTNEVSLRLGGIRIPFPMLDRLVPSLGKSLIVSAKKV